MRRFYRCKATLDKGWTRYLGRDATRWIGMEDRRSACVFATRREAVAAVVDAGDIWARLGRIVRITVRPKARGEG